MEAASVCVYVTPYFPGPDSWRGGFAYDAVRAREAEGADVRVLLAAADAREPYVYRGVRVVPFRHREGWAQAFQAFFGRANARAFSQALSAALEGVAGDVVVHLNTPALAPYASDVRRLFPAARTLVQFHQSGRPLTFLCGRLGYAPVLSALKRRLHLKGLAAADEWMFTSEAHKRRFFAQRELRTFFARVSRPVSVRRNPVDPSLFSPAPRAPREGFAIGCVANFTPQKDHATLLRALAILASRGVLSGVRAVLVGSGPTAPACRRLVARHRLDAVVSFAAERDHGEMAAFYRSIDLLVLPSREEAFGCVCAEAKACGTPFAVSSDAGAAEILDPSERARLTFPPGDAWALAAVIARAAGKTFDARPGICWWTVFPTPNQTAICRALRAEGVPVAICYFGRLDAYRRLIGWRERPLEKDEFAVSGPAAARRLIPDFDFRLQMVPGLSGFVRLSLLLACRLRRLSWFAVTESVHEHVRGRFLLRLFAFASASPRALAVFAHGGRARRQLLAAGVPAQKVAWLGYAIDPPARRVAPEEKTGPCVFVFCGALTERKGVDRLAVAWHMVRSAHPDARLVVVGDGPLRARLDALDGVSCLGARPPASVADELACGDAIVLPSRDDPWGVALVEGAAHGLAMIASTAAGASELIEDGVNGFRVDGVAALAEAMRAYAADPALARRHGAAAAVAASRLFAPTLAKTLLSRLDAARERLASVPPAVAASFWEEHCTECGAPACYASCPSFERGPTGRCRRIDADGTDFRETVRGAGRVRLRRWGKLEQMFHGRLWTPAQAAAAERLERLCAPVRRLFPRLYRSLRWRLARAGLAGTRGRPSLWRIDAFAERPERLTAQILAPDGRETFRRAVCLSPGRNAFAWPVPPLETGSLARLFATDGEETGWIDFAETALAAGEGSADEPRETYVKCLVWDLDGTLWDGTLAEDGVEGLRVRDDARALLETLDARGIVQSVASRNDPAAALEALRALDLERYFVFPQIGWAPKSESLRRFSEETGIAPGAIAFVDDRPEQRAEAAAILPAVRVYSADELPSLAGRPEFDPPATIESATRRLRYRDEMARRDALRDAGGGDAAAFYAAQGFRVTAFDLASASPAERARCEELARRTHRLNLTGRADALEGLDASPDDRAFGFAASDAFGDYGIVGFARLSRLADGAWRLASFALSCRVAGRGAEKAALARLREALAPGRISSIAYVDTGRNAALKEAWGL